MTEPTEPATPGRRVGAALGALLVAACAACGSSTAPLAGSRAGDPAGERSWPGPTSGDHLIVSDGRLYSEDGDDGVCFWFVSATGTVVSLAPPRGWSARGKPLELVDAQGRSVATTFHEGLGFTGHFEPGRVGCAPGGLSRSFAVTKVEQVGVGDP